MSSTRALAVRQRYERLLRRLDGLAYDASKNADRRFLTPIYKEWERRERRLDLRRTRELRRAHAYRARPYGWRIEDG